MKIVLLGATGKVGAPVLRELLARGHDVVAIARTVPDAPDGGATWRSGDVFDAGFLDGVAAGADVVVVSVALRDAGQADRSPVDMLAGIVGAATRAGARVVTLGGAGSLRTADGTDLVDDPRFPAAARTESEGFRDALRMLRGCGPGDAVWSMVSPPAGIEVDAPRTGSYRTAADTLVVDGNGRSHISAADLAVAVVDEVEGSAHPRARFAVGY